MKGTDSLKNRGNIRCLSSVLMFYFFFSAVSYGNCLVFKTTDFVKSFCQGKSGRFNFMSLDEQCERADPGANACGVQAVPASYCWQQGIFQCCGGNRPRLKEIAAGTPCLGSNPDLLYYCYQGSCVEGNSICGKPVTTSPATTTTTTPTTTATTHYS